MDDTSSRAARGPVAGLLGLLAPSRCLACRRRADPPWCPACAGALRWLGPGCPRCAAPRGAAHPCWPPDAPIDATVAVLDYRGPVTGAVVTAKVAGARAGWPLLGALLADAVGSAGTQADVVTWVTTPTRRSRRRGFDHAALLATAVGEQIGLPVRQLLDARPGRSGADRYHAACTLPGTQVLLVDDVLTTGATAWRAAAALRGAGAGRVELAVIARAGTHPLGVTSRSR